MLSYVSIIWVLIGLLDCQKRTIKFCSHLKYNVDSFKPYGTVVFNYNHFLDKLVLAKRASRRAIFGLIISMKSTV